MWLLLWCSLYWCNHQPIQFPYLSTNRFKAFMSHKKWIHTQWCMYTDGSFHLWSLFGPWNFIGSINTRREKNRYTVTYCLDIATTTITVAGCCILSLWLILFDIFICEHIPWSGCDSILLSNLKQNQQHKKYIYCGKNNTIKCSKSFA